VYRKFQLKPLCAALGLGVLAALAVPAQAAGTDAMKDLLKILRDKGSITQEEYDALVSASRLDEEATVGAISEIKAMNPPKIETKGKLEIGTPDGNFTWRLGGRIHWDSAFYSNDTGTFERTTMGSGTDMRRARLDLTATAWRVWQFKLQYDFADSDSNIDRGLRDAWIKYLHKGAQPFTVTMGQFKEYISLEEMTSSNDVTFVERSLPMAFNSPNGRRLGIGVSAPFHDMFTVSAGVFSRAIDSDENVDTDDSDPLIFTGRLTFSPIHTGNRLLHLAVAGSTIQPKDDDLVRYRQRPEAAINSPERLVDTGTLEADSISRLGFEAAGFYGPFSLQGEYLHQSIDGNTAADPDPDLNGWYIYGSWLMTGESRGYKFEDGVFNNPKPKGVVGQGGIGAWELVARYSTIDLTDGDEGIEGGEQDNFTIGVNWYPTQNLKFMANYVQVLDVEGGDFDEAEPSIVELRGQAYW
jgi:phosphate-selective porin OprO/OprP